MAAARALPGSIDRPRPLTEVASSSWAPARAACAATARACCCAWTCPPTSTTRPTSTTMMKEVVANQIEIEPRSSRRQPDARESPSDGWSESLTLARWGSR